MSLPIRTTVDDIAGVCMFLARRPTGATLAQMKQVLDSKLLDGRKLSALRFWGFVDGDSSQYKVTSLGRQYAKDAASRVSAIREVLGRIPAYSALIERVLHSDERSTSAVDVATVWHEHFNDEAGDTDKILNDQAVCFFRLAEGAGLGTFVTGRNGAGTRFDWDSDALRRHFALDSDWTEREDEQLLDATADDPTDTESTMLIGATTLAGSDPRLRRVFITHGKNKKLLPAIQKFLRFAELEPVVSVEKPTVSQPVPAKVMNEMRGCGAAIIHVDREKTLVDEEGDEVSVLNPNVLIEIGAAMALYGSRFILLVEKGTTLPSNLQGLFEVRYAGDDLDSTATIELLEAINDIKNHSLPNVSALVLQ